MKNLKVGFILITLLIFNGCSKETTETKTNGASNQPANSALVADSNNQPANSPPAQPGAVIAPGVEKIDPNAFNKTSEPNARVIPVDPKNDKKTSGIYGRTAPDNSTFNATMDASGTPVEIRTFQNHPILAKVERVFTSPTKTMKVYLKNGKVIQFSEEKLPNFAAVAPQNILIAAGIETAPPQQPSDGDSKDNAGKKQ